MQEKKALNLTPEAQSIADLVARGASSEEILKFARSTVGTSGGRATFKKYGRKYFSQLGKIPRHSRKLSTGR